MLVQDRTDRSASNPRQEYPDFRDMPRVRCERCNKPIAYGAEPAPPEGQLTWIQCHGCGQHNRFPRG